MIIARTWSDAQGNSHFADLNLPEKAVPVAAGLPDMRSTGLMPVTGFRLITTTAVAMTKGWHPAPARQFAMVIKGSIEVEVSDGERRRLDSGAMILFEDLEGRGHLNHATEHEELMLGFFLLPADWKP